MPEQENQESFEVYVYDPKFPGRKGIKNPRELGTCPSCGKPFRPSRSQIEAALKEGKCIVTVSCGGNRLGVRCSNFREWSIRTSDSEMPGSLRKLIGIDPRPYLEKARRIISASVDARNLEKAKAEAEAEAAA